MAKITIEIDDNLNDLVQDAIDGVKDLLKEYVEENKCEDLPCLNNDLDYSGAVHEHIDGLVPIYFSQLDGLWYLHKDKLIEAYEDAGIGDDPTENNGGTAIYCFLMQKVQEWYSKEAQDYFDSIKGDEVVDDTITKEVQDD